MNHESELLSNICRLAEIFLESYPDHSVEIETFVKWIYSQYGYIYPHE